MPKHYKVNVLNSIFISCYFIILNNLLYYILCVHSTLKLWFKAYFHNNLQYLDFEMTYDAGSYFLTDKCAWLFIHLKLTPPDTSHNTNTFQKNILTFIFFLNDVTFFKFNIICILFYFVCAYVFSHKALLIPANHCSK